MDAASRSVRLRFDKRGRPILRNTHSTSPSGSSSSSSTQTATAAPPLTNNLSGGGQGTGPGESAPYANGVLPKPGNDQSFWDDTGARTSSPAGSLPSLASSSTTLQSSLLASPPLSSRGISNPNGVVPKQRHRITGSQGQGLDRFATSYVPAWQLRVNDEHPLYTFVRSADVIDYTAYASFLYPGIVIHEMNTEAKLANERFMATKATATARPGAIPIRAPNSPPQLGARRASLQRTDSQISQVFETLPSLTPQMYAQRWLKMLEGEHRARIEQLKRANLFLVPLVKLDYAGEDPTKKGMSLYQLEAKSIREGWPPIDLGDTLLLRQLRPEVESWQGFVYEASVWSVSRASGQVVLRCDALKGKEESLIFNVVWRAQDRVFFTWHAAITAVGDALAGPVINPATPDAKSWWRPEHSLLENWLFPDVSHILKAPFMPYEEERQLDWVDPYLNEEQKHAVASIVTARHPIPYLLWGPPGSGKTKTCVETIFQILRDKPTTHILVCGASNPSSDTLLARLAKMLTPAEMLRLNDPSRPFAEVRDEVLPYCFIEGERFALPDITTLLKKRVIVTSCLDAALLYQAKCSNLALSRLEVHVMRTLHPTQSAYLVEPHFGHLLIDEAAQSPEPDIVVALSVAATDGGLSRPCHVTICGDPKQLGPTIVSQEARHHGMDVSLLERLLERDVYANHPAARKNLRQGMPRPPRKLDTAYCDLTKNYRSAAPILMIPSALFYNETLEPFAHPSIQLSPLLKWDKLPAANFPVMFKSIQGAEEPVDEGASFFNQAEVDAVISIVQDLLGDDHRGRPGAPLKPKEISVISPFREQVWRIRLALRALSLYAVDVGNVEALQGNENRVVIISTVRSDTNRWLEDDRAQGRGLIFEPRRFNVALTRAKELLCVVGDAGALAIDPWWKSFYRFCVRNGAFVGETVESTSEDDVAAAVGDVSRLEEAWHRQLRAAAGETTISSKQGQRGGDNTFDVLVGSVIREALLDE